MSLAMMQLESYCEADKLKLRDTLQNNWSLLFKTVNFMNCQYRLMNCCRLKETKEIS